MAHEHHHHEHHHDEGTKGKILLIVGAAILLVIAVLIEKSLNLPTWQLLLIYLIPYLLIGFDVLKEAAEEAFEGNLFVIWETSHLNPP